MFVCLSEFSSVDTAGGLYQLHEKEKNRIRGAVTKHLSDFLVLGCRKG